MNVKVTVEVSDNAQQKLRISDVSNSNKQCSHPKMQIWQDKQHWLCCKCWHQEQGKYADSIFAQQILLLPVLQKVFVGSVPNMHPVRSAAWSLRYWESRNV